MDNVLRLPHPFPAVEQWLSELESAERDFREVLEGIKAKEILGGVDSWKALLECVTVARRVLEKHPLKQEVKSE